MGIKAGNLPTSTIDSTDYLMITEGEAPKRVAYSDVKSDIIGTATLTTTSQTVKEAINEVNSSLSNKANNTDNTRTTTSKTVTGAINELNSGKANQTDITKQLGGGCIINGDFRINQRAVSGTVTLTAGQYGHDRWKAGASGCTYTFATSGGVTTITITAGSLIQVIEGINLTTGTYVLSWTGTSQGKIGAGSYATSGVSASVTGGSNLNIEFGTGTLANVKLEKGTLATPFIPRLYGEELVLCQRYFVKTPYQKLVRMSFYLANALYFDLPLSVDMRVTPSLIGTANTDYAVNTIAAGVPTGFTFSIGKISGGVSIGANKTAHGLTDGVFVLGLNSGLDAEL